MNFSVLDWNVQSKKYYTCTSFQKIQPELEKIDADIVCLQEGEGALCKLDYFTEIKKYNCISSHQDRDGTNVIMSKFKILKSGEINCPSFIDPSLGEVIWADVKIGRKILKIYNCHFEITGVGPKERAEAFAFILSDSKKHPGPTIICGDFNTTLPAKGFSRKFIQWFHSEPEWELFSRDKNYARDERYSFVKIAEKAKFKDVTDISKTTWAALSIRWELFHLKLDWFFVRDVKASEAILGEYISDHRSILVECGI